MKFEFPPLSGYYLGLFTDLFNDHEGVYIMKMNKSLSNLLKVTLLGSLFLTGCSKESSQLNPNTSDLIDLVEHKLFADRYQRLDYAVVLVHLKTPALLETSTFDESGKLILDQDHAAVIAKEQQEALAAAKALTDEAELLFTYKFTINALALSVPVDFYDQIEGLGMVNSVFKETEFKRPIVKLSDSQVNELIQKAQAEKEVNSVTHIQADKAHEELGITGSEIKVGIIDTGIDYTHKMLGGTGNPEDYTSIDPAADTSHFPNAKVVGGFDFCGTDFSSGPLVKKYTVPKPDKNPLDEQGHGTHVAGTVAGLGDGENTYSGVAPDAKLYALKVFGKAGGTRDTLVIKALEWAMDPNGDGEVDDRLDVLNLSLGGNYGKPQILYSLALRNLSRSKMITSISAGNSGPTPYIVGAPGTAQDSISVAASVDASQSNWKFPGSEFLVGDEALLYQRVEAQFTKPISEAPVTGKLVYIGEAATDLSDEVAAALSGNVALIDRGTVTFFEKAQRAVNAGATAIVVANNQPGDPITMSGDESVDIPGIMISLDQGKVIKDAVAAGQEVVVNLATDRLVEKPELIDQITSFSSQGPRSEDGLLKPEITAPGYQILSAQVASGTAGARLNGTSMSAPHMAGAMALVKQKFPTLSVEEIKALIMNNAKFLNDKTGAAYTMTLQGAGLVQIYDSLSAKAIALPSSFSLGQFQLATAKKMKKVLTVKNITDTERTYTVELTQNKLMSMTPTKITVKANSSAQVPVYITVTTGPEKSGLLFHEGLITLKNGEEVEMTVPVFGASKNVTDLKAANLLVHATSEIDSADALVELTMKNDSPNAGVVEAFNLLAQDDQKPSGGDNSFFLSRSCDLQAVGYRMVNEELLQIGVKIFNPVSDWQACELSVLIDSNGDKQADQEIGGLPYNYLAGLAQVVQPGFYSVLLDFPTAVGIRANYEQAVYESDGDAPVGLDYLPAIVDVKAMQTYSNSHLAIINVNPKALAKGTDGRIHMRVTTFNEGGIQYEDGLGLEDQWFSISSKEEEQSFRGLPTEMSLNGNQTEVFEFTKGLGSEELMLVYPASRQVLTTQTLLGKGLEVVAPQY